MFARFRDDNYLLPAPVPAPISGLRTAAGKVAAVANDARILSLPGNRRLAWAEYGHRHGFPVLYFHSQAGSRFEAELLHDAALAAGFRLIAVERPGMGLSDYRPIRRHADLNGDLECLIEHLNLVNPGLLAWSGGAPFALALASALGSRVSFVSVLAPVPEPVLGSSGGFGQRVLMGLMRLCIRTRQRWRTSSADSYLLRLRDRLCYADRKQLDNPWINELLRKDAEEAARQGTRGIAQDSVLSVSEWEFDTQAITAPVHVWQGSADTLTPPRSARILQRSLPSAVLYTVHRQGHFFFTCAADDIFRVARQALRSRRCEV